MSNVRPVKKVRPVNLDITTIHLPVTGYVSFLHRVSGVILLGGILVLLWMLDASLSSSQSFGDLQALLSSIGVKIIVWALLSALVYHTVAGIRHLIMDMGVGESLAGGRLGAKLVLIIALSLIVVVGVWLW